MSELEHHGETIEKMKTQPTKTVLKASRQGENPDVFCNSVGEYLKELFSLMEEAENA